MYERFEVQYRPKHASWLNLAECELSALGRQCLARRIDDQALLAREVQARVDARNQQAVRVDWQFTAADARNKLETTLPPASHDKLSRDGPLVFL